MSARDDFSPRGVRARVGDAVIAAIVVVALWQGIVWVTQVPAFILPGPLLVAETLVANAGLIADHATVTIAEVLIGLVVGAGLGAATALHLKRIETGADTVMALDAANF